MSLENETRAEFAARMDKEGNSRANMIAAYYGLLQWYRGKDDELQEAEAEVARLRAERDAARAAAATWKRAAKLWRGVSQLGDGYDGMMYRLVRRSDGHE